MCTSRKRILSWVWGIKGSVSLTDSLNENAACPLFCFTIWPASYFPWPFVYLTNRWRKNNVRVHLALQYLRLFTSFYYWFCNFSCSSLTNLFRKGEGSLLTYPHLLYILLTHRLPPPPPTPITNTHTQGKAKQSHTSLWQKHTHPLCWNEWDCVKQFSIFGL